MGVEKHMKIIIVSIIIVLLMLTACDTSPAIELTQAPTSTPTPTATSIVPITATLTSSPTDVPTLLDFYAKSEGINESDDSYLYYDIYITEDNNWEISFNTYNSNLIDIERYMVFVDGIYQEVSNISDRRNGVIIENNNNEPVSVSILFYNKYNEIAYLLSVEDLVVCYISDLNDIISNNEINDVKVLYLKSDDKNANTEIPSVDNLNKVEEIHIHIYDYIESIDISALEGKLNLNKLVVRTSSEFNVQLKNFKIIKSLLGLKYLEIGGFEEEENIYGIENIMYLTNLEELFIYWIYISDISFVSELAKLEVFVADCTSIEDISVLSNLTNIRRLRLSDSLVKDISPLLNLHNLEELNLDWNDINDLTPVSKLSDLVTLTIMGNYITDISVLLDLVNLRDLDISDNPIDDYSVLDDLPETVKVVK